MRNVTLSFSLVLAFTAFCCTKSWTLPSSVCLFASRKSSSDQKTSILRSSSTSMDVDTAAKLRYACKKFKRYDGYDGTESSHASIPNPDIVSKAIESLDVARLAPNAFNTQPYKMIIVHTPDKKRELSKCVLGPNIKRILDSDCTIVFLADRQVCGTFHRLKDFLIASAKPDRIPTRKLLLIMRLYITIFSSGYPLPRILAAPISFIVRTGVSIINMFTRKFFLLPTLANAETWSTKSVMLVAMTYMLCCSSRGLATCPMEGINASAIRKQLKIPKRYAIPLVIATGEPIVKPDTSEAIKDSANRRYPMKEIIYSETFGSELPL